MADQTIQCLDCRNDFVFTDGEQKFFADNNFTTPKRCKSCRAERKLRKAQSEAQPGAQQPRQPEQEEQRHSHEGRRKGGRRDNNY